jgi:accessory gene regulator protein AgrB
MATIAGLIMIALVALMFLPSKKKEAPRCPLCGAVLPPKPKQKTSYGSIILLIVLIILLAYAHYL